MFTGIIHEKVPLTAIKWSADGLSCLIQILTSHENRKAWKLGDSISLDGACLTIVQIEHNDHTHPKSSVLSFDVSKETLSKTHWAASMEQRHPRMQALHLEPALRVGDAFGGHVVSGHVEDVAILESQKTEGEYSAFTFSIPRSSEVSPFLIPKGSVSLDGVSLTVNQVWDEPGKTFFSIYLIPHTLEKCHFGLLKKGDPVNIESDLMARHYCHYKDSAQGTETLATPQQSIQSYIQNHSQEKLWV